ncbi:hypothetical protein Taro_047996, partial [Colocasia esculenta]|nr:hypothetical protein [Colocasia esculenta]
NELHHPHGVLLSFYCILFWFSRVCTLQRELPIILWRREGLNHSVGSGESGILHLIGGVKHVRISSQFAALPPLSSQLLSYCPQAGGRGGRATCALWLLASVVVGWWFFYGVSDSGIWRLHAEKNKMSSSHVLRQKGLRTAGDFILRGTGRNPLPGISSLVAEQAASTSGKSISPVSRLGSFSAILRERCLGDQAKAISSVGTLSRVFSLSSASGRSCRMASCSSLLGKAELSFQDRGSLNRSNGRTLNLVIRVGAADCPKWIECCSSTGASLKNQQPHGTNMMYKRFWSNSGESWNSKPFLQAGFKRFHASSTVSNSAGAAPDVSFDGSMREEQFDNSAVSSDQKVLGDRKIKLLSGSCYLPHPAKEETGGEDAHFICVDEQAIGVADGVGGWADLGVDAGQYARELMSHSVSAIQEEPQGSIDPARVLEKAYSSTKARGSSTACIIALTEQGVHAVNLGDSGFIVVRDGCTIFRSPVQQHDFNFTYQLESGNGSDLPSAAQVFTFPVAPGDVIIAGTDGLFDNLYNNEITAVVVHAVRAGLGPQVTAQKIAALARQRAQDKNRQTPFSTAAQDAGYRYYGGKLDDITVVVSYITAVNK